MFQKKCLNKMKEISMDSNKTILYVSHNMQTIRELCTRCIVLDQGQIIHDGDVEEGIRLYMQDILEVKQVYEFTENRDHRLSTGNVNIKKLELDKPVQSNADKELKMTMHYQANHNIEGLHLRFTVFDSQDQVVGTAISDRFAVNKEEARPLTFTFQTEMLVEGEYSVDLAVVEPLGDRQLRHAFLRRAMAFRIESRERLYQLSWMNNAWGNVYLGKIMLE